MSYNEEYFADNYIEINRSINILHGIQEDVLQLLIEFLLNCDRVDQKCKEHVPLLELSIKIRLNLEAIQLLLPSLTQDFRLKTPINLLYRGINSDLVNILYLLYWYDPSNVRQPILAAELDIFKSDFLKAVDEMIAAENEIVPSERENNASWKKKLIDDNPDLYDQLELKWMSTKQVRLKTGLEYNKHFATGDSTEKSRIMHIVATGPVHYHLLMKSFKYLSQYQHYSQTMHTIVMQDPQYDLQIYEDLLFCMLITMDRLSENLNYNSRENFAAKHNAIVTKFKEAYRKPQV